MPSKTRALRPNCYFMHFCYTIIVDMKIIKKVSMKTLDPDVLV